METAPHIGPGSAQSLEETERLVQLGMAPADAAGGLRLAGGQDGFDAHLDGILDEVCAVNPLLMLDAPSRLCTTMPW